MVLGTAHWDDLVPSLTNEILRRSTELFFFEFFFWLLSEDVVEIYSIGVLP